MLKKDWPTLYIVGREPNGVKHEVVQVFCPGCWELHTHGVEKGDSFPQSRVSHCRFPWSPRDYFIDENDDAIIPPRRLLFSTRDYSPIYRDMVYLSGEDLTGDSSDTTKNPCSMSLYRFETEVGCRIVKTQGSTHYLSFVIFDKDSDKIMQETGYHYGTRSDMVRTLKYLSVPAWYKEDWSREKREQNRLHQVAYAELKNTEKLTPAV